MKSILKNWDSLKAHFSRLVEILRGDPKFKAMLIGENLDDTNKAYLTLAYPRALAFEKASIFFFQKIEFDPCESCQEVELLCFSLIGLTRNSRGETLVPLMTQFTADFNALCPSNDERKTIYRDFFESSPNGSRKTIYRRANNRS